MYCQKDAGEQRERIPGAAEHERYPMGARRAGRPSDGVRLAVPQLSTRRKDIVYVPRCCGERRGAARATGRGMSVVPLITSIGPRWIEPMSGTRRMPPDPTPPGILTLPIPGQPARECMRARHTHTQFLNPRLLNPDSYLDGGCARANFSAIGGGHRCPCPRFARAIGGNVIATARTCAVNCDR